MRSGRGRCCTADDCGVRTARIAGLRACIARLLHFVPKDALHDCRLLVRQRRVLEQRLDIRTHDRSQRAVRVDQRMPVQPTAAKRGKGKNEGQSLSRSRSHAIARLQLTAAQC